MAAAISLTRAQMTGQWSLTTGTQPVPVPAVAWPEVRDRIAGSIRWLDDCKRRMETMVRTATVPVVSIAYEDVAHAPERFLRPAVALIDPDREAPVATRTTMRRQSDARSVQWRWAYAQGG